MKRVVPTSFGKSFLLTSTALLLVGQLAGCAVLGPVLTLGSLGFAPLQYASIAYTVGEYGYEYAANDNTPDQVIENKINAVVSGEAFELPDYLEYDAVGPEAPVMVAEAETQDPAAIEDARQERIEALLSRRDLQFQRLEVRRVAFNEGQREKGLSLRQTAMTTPLDLYQGSVDEVSLD